MTRFQPETSYESNSCELGPFGRSAPSCSPKSKCETCPAAVTFETSLVDGSEDEKALVVDALNILGDFPGDFV